MTALPRLRPLGEAAFTVELGEGIDPAVAARVRGLDHAVRARRPPWLRETVPTYRSLLVVFDPPARAEAEAGLRALAPEARAAEAPGRRHDVPVVYGGDDGPDLPDVARHCGLSEAQFVERHAAAEYTAFMLGFMPGFAYLGLLPPELETPRRATPRVRVPAGAVAVAARQTAIYPVVSAGGWKLIGRASLVLFDAAARPPALIQPGDRVRFHAVESLPASAAPVPAADVAAGTGEAAVEVTAPGLLTTVQDFGRHGWRHLGVPWSGAMDARALAAANAALGNDGDAAALECTLQGPTLRFLRAARFAVAGADLGAQLERADLGNWPVPLGEPVLARPGNVLRFTGRRSGCRAYVAFAGGLDVPAVLGSRATDLAAGLGGLQGRALRAGDRLRLLAAPPASRRPESTRRSSALPEDVTVLRVVAGPQDDLFGAEAWTTLRQATYRVQPASDRTGCRLSGPRLPAPPGEFVSDGMLPGSIQVPPDGQPIAMGPDGPTTGGYPKIATVIGADLPLLGQLAPGDRVRVHVVTVDEARRALDER